MSPVQIKQNSHLSHFLWLAVTLLWLGIAAVCRPLTLPDEGRYVGIAWEMLTSGNWAIPHLDGLPYFHKPPLFYWITAASFKLFGPSLLASRLASLLAALLMAIALYWFTARHLDKKTAVLAFVALVTQPFFFASAQFANLDMLVASMIAMTIMLAAEFIWSIEQGQLERKYLCMAMVFAAGGVLAKGLIGMVLPVLVVGGWLLVSRRLASLKYFLWWPALVLFFLMASPWFLCMESQFKGFLEYFFIHHHVQRFTGTHFNNQQPFWFYLPVLLALTLPASLWLTRLRKREVQRWSSRQQDVAWLMVCWLALILLFFSIPVSKPLGYIMPVLPAMAVLTAMGMRQAWQHRFPKRLWVTFLAAAVTCVIAMGMVIQHAQKTASFLLATKVQPLVSKQDQLILLNKYQFDLMFYLRLSHPAWMVADWRTAEYEVLDDSWEKELIEAKHFDPQTAANQLLTESVLTQHVCQLGRKQAVWVAGDSGNASHLPMLAGIAPIATVRDHYLWRFSPAQVSRFCLAKTRPRELITAQSGRNKLAR
ncbi:ArnT family glycosyltransferase [Methylophilus glucosoxydans]|uniref:ArnT family glycosyltransferase n=1 Tax=Methylophilus glucosoxydans TaxID=752553 RepID=A0ABW3GCJ7_9PROT